MGLRTLDQIAIEHQTDMATVFTRTYAKPKGYTVYLEPFFTPFRDKQIKLLEIGVAGGESIRTWLDFFPAAKVHGIDIVEKTNDWNSPGMEIHPRYKFLQGNQTDVVMWACATANWGKDWDIILDDGAHTNDGIITSFECLWPAVKPGGLYAIQDLGVATTPGSVFLKSEFPNHIDWIRSKVWEINSNLGDIAALHLFPELAIFLKK